MEKPSFSGGEDGLNTTHRASFRQMNRENDVKGQRKVPESGARAAFGVRKETGRGRQGRGPGDREGPLCPGPRPRERTEHRSFRAGSDPPRAWDKLGDARTEKQEAGP